MAFGVFLEVFFSPGIPYEFSQCHMSSGVLFTYTYHVTATIDSYLVSELPCFSFHRTVTVCRK